MTESGRGIAYLRQEGRGIGLYNKMDAYKLQEDGFDTYEANQNLGFKADSRDFAVVSKMLKCIGIKKVNLLTNNPKKVEILEENGISILKKIPTKSYVNLHNK